MESEFRIEIGSLPLSELSLEFTRAGKPALEVPPLSPCPPRLYRDCGRNTATNRRFSGPSVLPVSFPRPALGLNARAIGRSWSIRSENAPGAVLACSTYRRPFFPAGLNDSERRSIAEPPCSWSWSIRGRFIKLQARSADGPWRRNSIVILL